MPDVDIGSEQFTDEDRLYAGSRFRDIVDALLAHKENSGDKYGADLVKEVSPVAWQHINLYGRYEFREQPAPVDVEEIVRVLADIPIQTDSTLAA
jgi:Tn3 transposase DDE domain-containing protein